MPGHRLGQRPCAESCSPGRMLRGVEHPCFLHRQSSEVLILQGVERPGVEAGHSFLMWIGSRLRCHLGPQPQLSGATILPGVKCLPGAGLPGRLAWLQADHCLPQGAKIQGHPPGFLGESPPQAPFSTEDVLGEGGAWLMGKSNLVLSFRAIPQWRAPTGSRGWGETRNTAAPPARLAYSRGMSGVTLSQG